jgi:hypothetical protein
MTPDDLDDKTRHSVDRLTRMMTPTWRDVPYFTAATAGGIIAWGAEEDA